jgi:hypothetical protein
MELFKRKSVAILVTALAVVLSTMYSVNRTLGAACQEVTDGFYEGVFVASDGYRHPGISTHLNLRLDRANAIVSIAANYAGLEAQTAAVGDARDKLLAATESGSLSAQFDRNAELQAAVTALESAAANVSLSERDRENLDTCLSDMNGALAAIEDAGYNEAVRAFYRSTYYVFPTEFLASVSGVSAPELFE